MFTVVGAIAIAIAGVGLGAGLYAALRPNGTTTTVEAAATTAAPSSSTTASPAGGMSATNVYKETYQGVVDITVTSPSTSGGFSPFGGGGQDNGTETAEGSGIVYDAKGDIVTNQHVVAGETSISVKFWNGSTYAAKLIGVDASTDLAVVRVSADASELHPLTLGDSSKVQVGDPVIAIGSPFGYAETVTSGIVSALNRTMESPTNYEIDGAIQTDAAINHGNSGGPLIDAAGHVIGVNAQIESESGGSDGVGFAIPSNTVSSVVTDLAAGKQAQHAYLGVALADSASPAGAKVTQISSSSTPAAKAGLKTGDVITSLAGTKVTSLDDISTIMDAKKPGDKVTLTYLRGGASKTTTVTLGTRPTSS